MQPCPPSSKGEESPPLAVTSPDSKSQREDRIPFRTGLRFESDNGEVILKGSTANVSMTGAFLDTQSPPEGIQEGDAGVVFVEMKKDENRFEVSFHCVVARVAPNGIGLNFESDEDEYTEDSAEDEEA